MSYTENAIRSTGRLVGINAKYKAGHFYLMPDNKIYRAAAGTNHKVYSICTQIELDKLIEDGKVKTTAGAGHLCSQCDIDMGAEWLLGPVCGKCCRKNHRKVLGS